MNCGNNLTLLSFPMMQQQAITQWKSTLSDNFTIHVFFLIAFIRIHIIPQFII